MKHTWIRVRFIPPSGVTNAYFGRKCSECGLKTYSIGRLTRWVYPNGHVADTATIDAPDCPGRPLKETDHA